MEKILTIVGPTATGKTAIAIEVAKLLKGEVIGLDSRQIYFGMEIGTAQPSLEERQGILHHLIGIRSPHKTIAAGGYAKLVEAVVEDIKQRNNVPIICGGAGLYFRALREGIFAESFSNAQLRSELELQYDSSPQELLEQLIEIDPEYAKLVHINNKKRLVRALEIFQLTDKIPTAHFETQRKQSQSKLKLYTILLTVDRKLLFERICSRTNNMLKKGLIDETKWLMEIHKQNAVHPIDSIGYRQVKSYLDNKITYQQMIDEINIRSRQYAKRQAQWFSNEIVDDEIALTKDSKVDDIVEKIISNFTSLK